MKLTRLIAGAAFCVAAFGAVLMFLVPAGGEEKRSLITWEEAVQLPWGVILLFGGGISLGQAVSRTGLSEWLGNMLTALVYLLMNLLLDLCRHHEH